VFTQVGARFALPRSENMESRRTVWKIVDVWVCAGLLGLSLVGSMAAEGASSKSEESFAAAGVSASPAHDEATGHSSEDAGTSAAGGDFDGGAGSIPPFADIPLAALFLAVVCVIGAGLGPHAKRSRPHTKQDAVLPESQIRREGRAPN